MSATLYRIEYSIQRGEDGGDYEEIGFGTSFSHHDIPSALYDVDSFIQNGQWETTEGMPDPKEVCP